MPQGYDPKIRVAVDLELHEAMGLLILCGENDDDVISEDGVDYTLSSFHAAAKILRAMGRATGEQSWQDQAAALTAYVDQAGG